MCLDRWMLFIRFPGVCSPPHPGQGAGRVGHKSECLLPCLLFPRRAILKWLLDEGERWR